MKHARLRQKARRLGTILIQYESSSLERRRACKNGENSILSRMARLWRKIHSRQLILVVLICTGPQLATADATLERGTYLVTGPAGCGNCHTPMGPDGFVEGMELAGRLVDDSPAFTATAPNLTPSGAIAGWSDVELARAIREGIRPDGSVLGPPMPITLYRGLSDDDLMSMVMYLRQLDAVDNDPGTSTYRIELPPAYGPPLDSVASIPQGVRACHTIT